MSTIVPWQTPVFFTRVLPITMMIILVGCFLGMGGAFVPSANQCISRSQQSTKRCMADKTDSTDPYLAQKLVFRGMDAFRNGQVDLSIQLFDQAEAMKPSLTPYLWQRGLSYYYADRFAEASQQFRTDVQVNPLDVEEIVWDIGSQMRLRANESPNAMALPKGKRDRRKIMVCRGLLNRYLKVCVGCCAGLTVITCCFFLLQAKVYDLFRGEGTEHDLALAGHQSERYVRTHVTTATEKC